MITDDRWRSQGLHPGVLEPSSFHPGALWCFNNDGPLLQLCYTVAFTDVRDERRALRTVCESAEFVSYCLQQICIRLPRMSITPGSWRKISDICWRDVGFCGGERGGETRCHNGHGRRNAFRDTC